MTKKLLSIVALLFMVATSTWAQRYYVTFSGFDYNSYNSRQETSSVMSSNFIFTLYQALDGYQADEEANAEVDGGDGYVSVNVSNDDLMITIEPGFEGTATVRVTYFNSVYGATDIKEIVVTGEVDYNVENVYIDVDELTLTVGNTRQLWVDVFPMAADQTVIWSTSDESIATVSNDGLVTAVAAGTATITVTATNGTEDTSDDKTDDFILTVNNPSRTLSENENNYNILCEDHGHVLDITLGRTLKADGWNSFAVPFNTAIPSGWTVMKLESSTLEDQTLYLNFTNDTKIDANVPYLVKVETEVVNPTFEGVTVSVEGYENETHNPSPKATNYALFVPIVNRMTVPADERILFIENGNTLTYPTEQKAMPGFRAIFILTNDHAVAARTFQMNFGDETTGIKTIGNAARIADSSAVYDLQGRRVATPTRGLYIVNGKKVVVK